MENVVAIAKLRNLHIAPRKVRLVSDVVRGMHVVDALAQLQMMTNRSTEPLSKLIESAIANARNNNANTENLVISKITVDKGITLRRTLPRARGRATVIEKKMSHVTLELSEAPDKGTKFVMPKKAEKAKKEPTREKRETPKPKIESEQQQSKERAGVMKKVFRRKSI